jgi:hypothetical protein
MFLMTQVHGQFLVQRGLQDRLGQLLQQPVRPVRDNPYSRAWRTSSSAARCSGLGSGLIFFGTPSSVAAPFPPNHPFGDKGRKHR